MFLPCACSRSQTPKIVRFFVVFYFASLLLQARWPTACACLLLLLLSLARIFFALKSGRFTKSLLLSFASSSSWRYDSSSLFAVVVLVILYFRLTRACVQSQGTCNEGKPRLCVPEWLTTQGLGTTFCCSVLRSRKFLANFAATPLMFSVGFSSISFYLSLSRSLLYPAFTVF